MKSEGERWRIGGVEKKEDAKSKRRIIKIENKRRSKSRDLNLNYNFKNQTKTCNF